MDPVLIEVPERIETERLILRCPRPGDGPTVNEAERETRAELRPWMPWAHTEKTLDDSEAYCRRMQARYLLREDLAMFIFERDVMGREGRFLGGTGLHRIDWSLRGFEIGYWRRTGCGAQGYVTEAVRALTRFAFDQLAARRVEIRTDDANSASWKLAERAGFTLEALLRGDSLTPFGEVRSTRVYARVRGIEEPLGYSVAK
ncbi:MAG: GNAT family N-acetyltransferase [Proteobacteria bacterium]|nr:GNAT family N-acetyltransferase [Pseudomonadota bacterium]